MKNAHDFGQQGNIAHPLYMSQAWLRMVKWKPGIQQADAIAPAFQVLASF
jgi:hypothetical protein